MAQIAEVKGRALPQISADGQFFDNYSFQEQQLPGEFFGGEPGTTVGVAFGNRYQFTGGLSVQQQLINFQLFSSIKSTAALKELRNLQTLESPDEVIFKQYSPEASELRFPKIPKYGCKTCTQAGGIFAGKGKSLNEIINKNINN